MQRWRGVGVALMIVCATPAPAAVDEHAANMAQRWGDAAAGDLIDRGLAAVRARQFDRASRLSVRIEKDYPAEPARLVIRFALSVEQSFGNAADLFARMAAERASRLAAPLPLLEPALVRRATYRASGQAAVRLAHAIVDSGWSSGPGASEPTSARRTLIDDALARGDVPLALHWLEGIEDAFTLRDFLILDEYDALRPAIVARWGGDLAILDRRQGESFDRLNGTSPPVLVAERAGWLTRHGRAAEAVAVAAPAMANAAMAAPEVRIAVAVAAARAAARTGSPDDAIALLDKVAAAVRSDDILYDYVLTVRAVMLGDLGRARDALVAAGALQAIAGKGDAWVGGPARLIAACAAADLGDRATAQRELAALLATGNADLLKAQGLLCVGETERAAAVVVSALQRRRGVEPVRWLQDQPEPWGRWQGRWNTGFSAMRTRADIRQALAGYGVVRRFAVRLTDD